MKLQEQRAQRPQQRTVKFNVGGYESTTLSASSVASQFGPNPCSDESKTQQERGPLQQEKRAQRVQQEQVELQEQRAQRPQQWTVKLNVGGVVYENTTLSASSGRHNSGQTLN